MAVEAGLTMEGGKEAVKDEGERARRGGGEDREETTKGGRGGGDRKRRVDGTVWEVEEGPGSVSEGQLLVADTDAELPVVP